MKTNLLIIAMCLFGFAQGQAQVQERKKFVAPGVLIEHALPEGWGNPIEATIIVLDSAHHEVKHFHTFFDQSKPVTMDVTSLAAGQYELKVKLTNADDSLNEFSSSFCKRPNFKTVSFQFESACKLARPATKPGGHAVMVDKPVIYLYPEQEENVSVKIKFEGSLVTTIPAYNNGWSVTASPDGAITNTADGKNYPYLFWEGATYKQDWDMKDGFVVSGDSTRAFLLSILPKLGLLPHEYNEFIAYWLPRMQENPANLIHFAGAEYEAIAPLSISPAPDAILRVFMVFKPVPKTMVVPPQVIKPFTRTGFTVVEWGGTELDGYRLAGN